MTHWSRGTLIASKMSITAAKHHGQGRPNEGNEMKLTTMDMIDMTSLDQVHADAMAEIDAADEADEIANRMFNSDEERERLELEDYSN